MNELLMKLFREVHAVEVITGPVHDTTLFREQVDRGRVLIKFTDTDGGTELCVGLDITRCNLSNANWDACAGNALPTGQVVVDCVPIRVVAEIELRSIRGLWHLEILASYRNSPQSGCLASI